MNTMKNLYFVTAYIWSQNRWDRFAITSYSEDGAIDLFKKEYDEDNRYSRESARYICTTTNDVFDEL
jgi:hypothetical protein